MATLKAKIDWDGSTLEVSARSAKVMVSDKGLLVYVEGRLIVALRIIGGKENPELVKLEDNRFNLFEMKSK